MAGITPPPIIEQIILDGGKQVEDQLNRIGDAGQRAFSKIQTQAGKLNLATTLDGVQQSAKRVGDTFTNLGAKVAGVSSAGQAAVNTLRDTAKGAGVASGAVAAVGDAAEQTGGNIRRSNESARQFGLTLRALGRVSGAHELTFLGRSISLVSRNFATLAPLAIAAGLAVVANSASNAATKVLDLAQAGNTTAAIFQGVVNSGIAAGVSASKLTTEVGKFQGLLQRTISETHAADSAQATYNNELTDARNAAIDATDAYATLNKEQTQLSFNLGTGKISVEDYIKGQQELRDKTLGAVETNVRAEENLRRLEATYKRNRDAALQNAGALTRLGISARNTAGQLKDPQELLSEIADAFSRLPEGANKSQIANELFGEAARRLIPFLNQGSAGIEKLRVESERLVPALTAAQLAAGDTFTAAIVKLGEVLSNLKNQFGLAIAPAFVDTLNSLLETIVRARPSIIQFAEALGSVLRVVLDGIGTALGTIIIPAFQGFSAVLQLVANLINLVFGTNLNAMQIFVAIVVALAIAFTGWIPLIIAAVAAVGQLIEQIKKINFAPAADSAKAVWDFITKLFDGTFFVQFAQKIVAAFVQSDAEIAASINNTVNAITAKWNEFWSWLGGKIKDAVESFKQLLGLQAQSAGGEQTAPGFDEGGLVRGRPGRDKNLAWLSDFEYIMNPRAVRKYGPGFMSMINSLRFPGFAEGGLNLSPRFAGIPIDDARGRMGSQSNLTLVLDGETFPDLFAPDDTFKRLSKVAARKSILSTGRKPSHFGGGR